MSVSLDDLRVRPLGECRHASPFSEMLADKRTSPHYVAEDDRVLLDDTVSVLLSRGVALEDLPSLEAAGPRKKIYFESSTTTVGIVTCGGLCPGLNDVIRGIVQELSEHYRAERIVGFRNGFKGLTRAGRDDVIELTLDRVRDINNDGGTILGSSRGAHDVEEMVDSLVALGIDVLFVIGGDGSMRGAMAITSEVDRRGAAIGVVGVPKTIDNDLPYTDQSFGFQTAFARATDFIASVFIESQAAENGVGIVKLMGRHSGFIACYAALSVNDADFVLIPEVPFGLDGDDGLLCRIEQHLRAHGQVVVVVAEGAGQDLLELEDTRDASGNTRLGDIGLFLKAKITERLSGSGIEPTVRYLDPSYAIRSVAANAYDSVYCVRLAHAAVHAGMAGRTETVVVRWRRRFVHVPMGLITGHRNQVDPDGDLWMSVLEATGQPATFGR